jgi:hypothetical protein
VAPRRSFSLVPRNHYPRNDVGKDFFLHDIRPVDAPRPAKERDTINVVDHPKPNARNHVNASCSIRDLRRYCFCSDRIKHCRRAGLSLLPPRTHLGLSGQLPIHDLRAVCRDIFKVFPSKKGAICAIGAPLEIVQWRTFWPSPRMVFLCHRQTAL